MADTKERDSNESESEEEVSSTNSDSPRQQELYFESDEDNVGLINPFTIKKKSSTWNPDHHNFRCYYTILILCCVGVGGVIGYFIGLKLASHAQSHQMLGNNNNNENIHFPSGDTKPPTMPVLLNSASIKSPTMASMKNGNTNMPSQRPSIANNENKGESSQKDKEEIDNMNESKNENKNDNNNKQNEQQSNENNEKNEKNEQNEQNENKGNIENNNNGKLDSLLTITGDSEWESFLNSINIDWGYEALSINDNNVNGLKTAINFDNRTLGQTFDHCGKHSIIYPSLSETSAKYETNAYHRWCFAFDLSMTSNFARVQIDIEFLQFSLERGFDRVLIREFNKTEMKPPLIIAGRGFYDFNNKEKNDHLWYMPDNVTFYINKGESKGICIELLLDDSNMDGQINNENENESENGGLMFDVITRYDVCEWDKWQDCTIIDDAKAYWDRGPFWDNTCGIGFTQQIRKSNTFNKNVVNDDLINNIKSGKYQGFVNCESSIESNKFNNEDSYSVGLFGPKYCIKGPCGDIDETHNPNVPANEKGIRYGWAHPYSSVWSGHGRLDPDIADIFDITFASANSNGGDNNEQPSSLFGVSYPFYKNSNIYNNNNFNLDTLLNNLKTELSNTIGRHIDERVLSLDICEHEYFEKSGNWLGARLAHSLIVGRPFVMVFTGSSNTAGHDNMYGSTYSIQLQSHLRPFWQKIGNNGASFNVRNVAIGGPVSTNSWKWIVKSVSSETTDFFNENGNFYLNNKVDMLFWESFMNDGGRPQLGDLELHMHNAAYLNAIWGGFDMEKQCDLNKGQKSTPWDDLLKKRAKDLGRGFDKLIQTYGEYMGFTQIKFYYGLAGACEDERYQHLKMNWHPSPSGHRYDSDVLAYYLLSSVIKYIETKKSDMSNLLDANGQVTSKLDLFLTKESGNWQNLVYKKASGKEIVAQNGDSSVWPEPLACLPYCKYLPFTLTSWRPLVWNTGNRFQDYLDLNMLLPKDMNNVNQLNIDTFHRTYGAKWKWEYFGIWNLNDNTGWSMSDPSRGFGSSYDSLLGSLGSCDKKYYLYPRQSYFLLKFKEYVLNEEHDDSASKWSTDDRNAKNLWKDGTFLKYAKDGAYLEKFSNYLKQKGDNLKFYIKIPKYGSNSLMVTTGTKGNAIGKIYSLWIKPMKLYENVNVDNKIDVDNGNKDLSKMCDSKLSPGCHITGLTPGKYLIEVGISNLTDWNSGIAIASGY